MNEMKSGNTRQITGYERLEFTNEWIKRGRPKTQEEFIKKVCEVKGITYTPPRSYAKQRNVIIDEAPSMFPVKRTNGQ